MQVAEMWTSLKARQTCSSNSCRNFDATSQLPPLKRSGPCSCELCTVPELQKFANFLRPSRARGTRRRGCRGTTGRTAENEMQKMKRGVVRTNWLDLFDDLPELFSLVLYYALEVDVPRLYWRHCNYPFMVYAGPCLMNHQFTGIFMKKVRNNDPRRTNVVHETDCWEWKIWGDSVVPHFLPGPPSPTRPMSVMFRSLHGSYWVPHAFWSTSRTVCLVRTRETYGRIDSDGIFKPCYTLPNFDCSEEELKKVTFSAINIETGETGRYEFGSVEQVYAEPRMYDVVSRRFAPRLAPRQYFAFGRCQPVALLNGNGYALKNSVCDSQLAVDASLPSEKQPHNIGKIYFLMRERERP